MIYLNYNKLNMNQLNRYISKKDIIHISNKIDDDLFNKLNKAIYQ